MAITTLETQQFNNYNNNSIPIMHFKDSHPSKLSFREFDK
jgi:hypothetical protein